MNPQLPALPALPARPTVAMGVLSAMPVQRAATDRPTRIQAGQLPDLTRKTNLEAYLGQMVGQISVASCTHCTNNHGPWTLCVTVPGQFIGSCANCHFGSQGTRCSLRTSQDLIYGP